MRKDSGDALKADCWLHDDFCQLNYLKFVPKEAQNLKAAFMGPSIADFDEEFESFYLIRSLPRA